MKLVVPRVIAIGALLTVTCTTSFAQKNESEVQAGRTIHSFEQMTAADRHLRCAGLWKILGDLDEGEDSSDMQVINQMNIDRSLSAASELFVAANPNVPWPQAREMMIETLTLQAIDYQLQVEEYTAAGRGVFDDHSPILYDMLYCTQLGASIEQ